MRFAIAFAFASVSLVTVALVHPFGRTADRAAIESSLNHQLDASLHKRLARLVAQQDGSPDRTTLTQR